MRYKYAKIKRDDTDYILVVPYGSVELKSLINKHDPKNRNVIILQKEANGKNKYAAIDNRKLVHFAEYENFENLKWKEAYID